MIIECSSLTEMVTEAWDLVLGQPLSAVEGSPLPEGQLLMGCVQFAGGWCGSVTVSVREDYAHELAGIIFGQEDGLSTEEVNDALGEMANIIAGNLKALLPPETQISLPIVSVGTLDHLRFPGAKEASRSFLCSGSHEVFVRIYEQSTTKGAGSK